MVQKTDNDADKVKFTRLEVEKFLESIQSFTGLDFDMLNTFIARLGHAYNKHPEGATLQALVDETVEVEVEVECGDWHQYTYELYDVMAVAWRLIEQAKDKL